MLSEPTYTSVRMICTLPKQYPDLLLLFLLLKCILNRVSRFFVPGAIFENENDDQEVAFKTAIDLVNADNLLPGYFLKPLTRYIEPENIVDPHHSYVVGETRDNPFKALEVSLV